MTEVESGGTLKVAFRLEQDADGWPPREVEHMWARSAPDGVEIENIPFFARGYAWHDVIDVHPDADGVLWAGDVVRRSGYCCIRLVLLADWSVEGGMRPAAERFTPFGVGYEGYAEIGMLALNVPPGADLAGVARPRRGRRRRHLGVRGGVDHAGVAGDRSVSRPPPVRRVSSARCPAPWSTGPGPRRPART